MVYGEAKKFLVAGVWLNEEAVAAHLADVAPEARDAARRALVQKRIDQVNAELASYETLKKFVILSEPLTVEDELLTAVAQGAPQEGVRALRDDFEALYDGPPPESARKSEREAQA